MWGASIQIGFFAKSTPPFTITERAPTSFRAAMSYSCIQIARCPSYSAFPTGGPLLRMYVLPSSSKKNDGSIPSSSESQTGSDHGPAASFAVTKKLPPRSTSVVIM
jgi:hypothetical protein